MDGEQTQKKGKSKDLDTLCTLWVARVGDQERGSRTVHSTPTTWLIAGTNRIREFWNGSSQFRVVRNLEQLVAWFALGSLALGAAVMGLVVSSGS